MFQNTARMALQCKTVRNSLGRLEPDYVQNEIQKVYEDFVKYEIQKVCAAFVQKIFWFIETQLNQNCMKKNSFFHMWQYDTLIYHQHKDVVYDIAQYNLII